jgi:hypothetical protein
MRDDILLIGKTLRISMDTAQHIVSGSKSLDRALSKVEAHIGGLSESERCK